MTYSTIFGDEIPSNDYQQQRANAIDFTIGELEASGLSWHSNNNNIHIIVTQDGAGIADIWPTTGRWKIRQPNHVFKDGQQAGTDGVFGLVNSLWIGPQRDVL